MKTLKEFKTELLTQGYKNLGFLTTWDGFICRSNTLAPKKVYYGKRDFYNCKHAGHILNSYGFGKGNEIFYCEICKIFFEI